jgi:hypothetical protein
MYLSAVSRLQLLPQSDFGCFFRPNFSVLTVENPDFFSKPDFLTALGVSKDTAMISTTRDRHPHRISVTFSPSLRMGCRDVECANPGVSDSGCAPVTVCNLPVYRRLERPRFFGFSVSRIRRYRGERSVLTLSALASRLKTIYGFLRGANLPISFSTSSLS